MEEARSVNETVSAFWEIVPMNNLPHYMGDGRWPTDTRRSRLTASSNNSR